MKKYSLAVAIPAYNEEATIELLLLSLTQQKLTRFRLENICVYSDNSTDNTHAIVRKLSQKFPSISLHVSSKRLGKYLRMGQIFKKIETDFVVVLDADIALKGKSFLEKLCLPFLEDKTAMMISAHQILLRPQTVVGKILHTHFVLWDFIRWSVPGYQNANSFYGSATAFRSSYAKKLNISPAYIDPHMYLYLSAESCKGFRYATDAVMYQQCISTWEDFNKLLHRTLGKKDVRLEQEFGVDTELSHIIPLRYKLKGIRRCFRWKPLYTIPAILLIGYVKAFSNRHTDSSAVWNIVSSTKKSYSR